MPVTFFIFGCSFNCFVIIVLNAKPKQNDVAIAKNINVVLFILSDCLLFVVSSVMLTTNDQDLQQVGIALLKPGH